MSLKKINQLLIVTFLIASAMPVAFSGCDFGGDDDYYDDYDDDDETEGTYYSESSTGPSSCITDGDCSSSIYSVCGAVCHNSPTCMSPGDIGTACSNDRDCRGSMGLYAPEYRCILGVCEDTTYRGLDLNNDICQLSSNLATTSGTGQIQPPGNACWINDNGNVIHVITMAPNTSGSLNYPGPGWWKISFPYESLLSGTSQFFVAAPVFVEAQTLSFDEFGLDSDLDVELDGYYNPPNDMGFGSDVYVQYVEESGATCLGSSGRIVVEGFDHVYYESVCSDDLNGERGEGRIALDLRFEDVTCVPAGGGGGEAEKADEGTEPSYIIENGVFKFAGDRGDMGTPTAGPGNSNRAAGGGGSGFDSGGSSGGDSGSGGSAGGGGTCAGGAPDQTPYFNDIQYDSFCMQASMYCDMPEQKSQICSTLISLCEATETNCSVCPHCP